MAEYRKQYYDMKAKVKASQKDMIKIWKQNQLLKVPSDDKPAPKMKYVKNEPTS